MRSFNELSQRFNEIKNCTSISGASSYLDSELRLFEQAYSAIRGDLSSAVSNYIRTAFGFQSYASVKYENDDALGISGAPAPPAWLYDFTTLFDTSAENAFWSMTPQQIASGFGYETSSSGSSGSGSSGSGTVQILKNTYVENYRMSLAQVSKTYASAVNNAAGYLESLLVREGSFPEMFENRGKVISVTTASRRKKSESESYFAGVMGCAEELYITWKVKKVIDAFNLSTYVPTYLRGKNV